MNRSLDQLNQRLVEIQSQSAGAHQKLKVLAKYNEYLHHALVELLNEAQLNDVQHYVEYSLEDTLFAVEGWVPVDKVELLAPLIEDKEVYYEEVLIEERQMSSRPIWKIVESIE